MTMLRTAHLRLYERNGGFIVFNPSIPNWIYTNAVGAILLRLVAAGYTADEATGIAVENGVTRESCDTFFAEAASQNLFYDFPKSEKWSEAYAKTRKLSSIYLHLTNKCNLSCSYCYRNSSPRIEIKRFGDEFNRFLDQCVPILSDNPVLTFSGGEPMIHPDFMSVAQHAVELGFSNNLLTNGMFITEENVAAVAKLFSYIKISLDGANEATHSATRGPGNFDVVMRGIRLLASMPGDHGIEVQMTLTAENAAQGAALKAQLPDRVGTRFTPLMPMGRGLQEGNYLDSDDFIAVSRANARDAEIEAGSLQPGQRTFGCYAGEAHISIADNGSVYPCHLFHRSEFRMGNIFVDPIEDIFFGEKMSQFGESMDVENNNLRCSSCDFRYMCGGGCKANALHKFGDYRKSDSYCSFIRQSNLDRMFAGHPDERARLVTG
jgi:radical SAM protein with 4Fe4S-binding SPASM domain